MRKIRAAMRVFRFMMREREEGRGEFQILTTGHEIIVTGYDSANIPGETIRVLYKNWSY